MDIQQVVKKASFIVFLGFMLTYTVLYFIENGFTQSSWQGWGMQIGISVCTSALVTGIMASVSYKRLKKDYFISLGKDFRRLYDLVDDYLCIQSGNDLYFEEYYSFRREFLNYVITAEKEEIDVSRKEFNILQKAMEELYLIPRGMLYYSYKYVKAIEKDYLQKKSYLNRKEIKHYKAILDHELSELNECLIRLKEKNKYNTMADIMYEIAGINNYTMFSIDDFESGYRKKFQKDEEMSN